MKENFRSYQRKFILKAKNNGYSEENIRKCLSYAEPLIKSGVPVIYNTSHFSALVGYQKSYIKRAVMYPKYFYRHFKILKKNGEPRNLSEPLPSLKEIQTWVQKEILYKIKVSRYAKAYVLKRGLKDHIKYHSNQRKVLTLDIKKFFDSIDFKLVEKVFLELGYSKLIANLLTKICYLDGVLPQGAPTSPYLSNIILKDFDDALSDYCRENDLKYTRYADDLAFSGNLKKIELTGLVKAELRKLGLKLNPNKTRLMKPNQPQIISGIVVNAKSQVPKSYRNKIRNEMFYIKKFGLISHLEKSNQTKSNYLKHLIGKINYLLFINPKDEEFIAYKTFLYSLN